MGTNDNARVELERQAIDDAYAAVIRGMFGQTLEMVAVAMLSEEANPTPALRAFARSLGTAREVRATALKLIITP